MSAETDFQALLDAHAPLTALVGTRIGLGAVPPPGGDVLSAVVYLARHDFTYGMGSTLLADAVTFTVQCWADSAVGAAAIAAEVRAAVATAPAARCSVVTGEEPVYDEETGFDAVVLSVEWWPAV